MPIDRPDDARTEDEELAAMLAAYDAQPRPREEPTAVEPSTQLDDADLGRWARAAACVDLLHRIWPDRTTGESPARNFGKFEILRELGRGGHGVVFLAKDSTLHREVALKVPRPELLEDERLRKRFLREARAAGMLDHPGIVPVHELGEVGPVCYIASAVSRGETLSAWLSSREGPPLSPRWSARIVLMVAEAVAHAHSRGVVHRDLKPSNILLEPSPEAAPDADGPALRTRITDFGLAKLLEAEAEITQAGAVLGTPRYMAPEQASGDHSRVGPATDVYALGMMLREMLEASGKPQPGVAPLCPTMHEAGPPRNLAAILRKCIRPNPEDRYPDAAALAADLRRFLDGKAPRATSHLRGHLRLGIAAGAVAIVGLASAIAIASKAGRGSRPPIEAPSVIGGGSPVPSPLLNRYVSDLRVVDEILPRELGNSLNTELASRLIDEQRPGPGEPDIRSLDWYHLHRRLHDERATLAGHRGPVFKVAFSPDGSSIASAGEDGARLWDATTQSLRTAIGDHGGDVNWVAFAPDGSSIATASDDRTVSLWRCSDGSRLLGPLAHPGKVVAVVFAHGGRWLVSGDREGWVIVRERAEGRELARWHLDTGPVEGMARLADEETVAVATSGCVHYLDVTSGQISRSLRADEGSFFRGVSRSRDGRFLATAGGFARGLRTWRADAPDAPLYVHSQEIESLAFSPDGTLVASAGTASNIGLHDLRDPDDPRFLLGHAGRVWDVAFSPDGRTLASAGEDGTVRLWDTRSRAAIRGFAGAVPQVASMAFSADNRSIVTLSTDGSLRDWDLAGGLKREQAAVLPGGSSREVVLAPGASRIARALADGSVVVTGRDGSGAITLPLAADPAGAHLQFSRDGSRLAFAAKGGQVAWTDLDREGAPVIRLNPAAPEIGRLAFAPDGRLLAASTRDEVAVWALPAGTLFRRIPSGHVGPLRALAMATGAAAIVTGGEDGRVLLHEGANLESMAVLGVQDCRLEVLAITADGRSAVWATAAGEFVVTNLATRRNSVTLRWGHDRAAIDGMFHQHPRLMCIAPDESAVAGCLTDLTLRRSWGTIWLAPKDTEGPRD